MAAEYFRNPSVRKAAAFYIILQIVIWIKTAVFFFYFGRGQINNEPYKIYLGLDYVIKNLFASPEMFFDFSFHQIMHVLVFISIFWFAKNLKKIEPLSLAAAVLIASFLHNVSYWLTDVFSSPLIAFLDFWADAGIISTAILVIISFKKVYMF